jgi:hypothetical protein
VRERLKEPRKGSEIDPEIVCVQGVGAGLSGDSVLFVERSSELLSSRKPKSFDGGAVKASLNRAKLVVLSRPETR